MPVCTWMPESGGNYRARNPISTAGGKYQILDSTWAFFGGINYKGTHDGAQAPKLEQEIVARRVLKGQGIHAWVNC